MDEDPIVDEKGPLTVYQVRMDGDLSPAVQLQVTPSNFANWSPLRKGSSDNSSIEGIVVSSTAFKNVAGLKGDGPFFAFLDERDREANGHYTSKLYFGARKESSNLIQIVSTITFPLDEDVDNKAKSIPNPDDHYRLPELFQYRDDLYALKTRKGNTLQPSYEIVHLDLIHSQLKVVCDFSKLAADLLEDGFDTNFEGATVASDGTLFLTADNEDYQSSSHTPRGVQAGRGKTPLIALEPIPTQ